MTTAAPVDEVVCVDPRTELPRWRPAPYLGRPTLVVLPPMLLNVLDSLCEGKTNRAIGIDWGIAEDTVKTHLKRVYEKLGARDRVHAVALVFSGAVDVRIKPTRQRRAWPTPTLGDYL